MEKARQEEIDQMIDAIDLSQRWNPIANITLSRNVAR